MKIDKNQRAFVADKLMDSANYALAGLVFGQVIAREVQPLLVLLGILIYFFGWSITIQLKKGVAIN